MTNFLDFLVHLDKHVLSLIAFCGNWTYLALFMLIFGETGLVIAPFLPGDSLLFTLGSIAAFPETPLSILLLLALLIVASVSGNQVNYWLGAWCGPRIFTAKKSFFFNPNHLEQTKKFYKKYGAMTIVLARFLPIIRTFAPFVAGVSSMPTAKFLLFNIVGGVLWISTLLGTGYFFGSLPVVKENFSLFIYGIIAISLLPAFIALLKTLNSR